MASQNVMDGDLVVRGTVRPTGLAVPAGAVGDAQFTAASPLTAVKQEHQYPRTYRQAHGTAAVAERTVAHVAYAAGVVTAVRAGVVVACVGAAQITVDVKKNGTTILSATIVLDNTNAAYSAEAGPVSSAAYAAGDVFEVVVTVAAGGGTLGQGLFVDLVLREASGG